MKLETSNLAQRWTTVSTNAEAYFLKNSIDNCKKLKFKIECKGQIYKTAEIILLCHKVLCRFCTVIFTSELIAKRHSLSCHYKCDYSTNALI